MARYRYKLLVLFILTVSSVLFARTIKFDTAKPAEPTGSISLDAEGVQLKKITEPAVSADSGFGFLYFGADDRLHIKDENGTASLVGGDGANKDLSNLNPTAAEVLDTSATYSDTPTGAAGIVTLTAANIGTVGNAISLTGALTGGGGGNVTIENFDSATYGIGSNHSSYLLASGTFAYYFPINSPLGGNLSEFKTYVAPMYYVSPNYVVPTSGQYEVDVWPDSGGGLPDTSGPSALSTTTTVIDYTQIITPTAPQIQPVRTFAFPSDLTMLPGVTYWVKITFTGEPNASMRLYQRYHLSTPPNPQTAPLIKISSNNGASFNNGSLTLSEFTTTPAGATKKTITALVGEWNAANPTNTVIINAGSIQQPDSGVVIPLAGGLDAADATGSAVNQSLISDTASTYKLGTGLIPWLGVYSDFLDLTEMLAPTIPSDFPEVGSQKLYFDSVDNELYRMNSDGLATIIGAGTGGSSVEVIQNNTFGLGDPVYFGEQAITTSSQNSLPDPWMENAGNNWGGFSQSVDLEFVQYAYKFIPDSTGELTGFGARVEQQVVPVTGNFRVNIFADSGADVPTGSSICLSTNTIPADSQWNFGGYVEKVFSFSGCNLTGGVIYHAVLSAPDSTTSGGTYPRFSYETPNPAGNTGYGYHVKFSFNAGVSFTETSSTVSFPVYRTVYSAATGSPMWGLAKADDIITSDAYVVSEVSPTEFTALKSGEVYSVAHGFTENQDYWLDQSTAGAVTDTEPTSGITAPLFRTSDSNTLLVNASRPLDKDVYAKGPDVEDHAAVSQDIVSDGSSRDLGTTLLRWAEGYIDNIYGSSINVSDLNIDNGTGAEANLEVSANTFNVIAETPNTLNLSTRFQFGADTQDAELSTGNSITGSSNSGSLVIKTGTAGGTRGNISIDAPVVNVTGQLNVSSVTDGSKPCPVMSSAQMLAIVAPVAGDCVYNSNDETQYNYNGTLSVWEIQGAIAQIENVSDWIDDGTITITATITAPTKGTVVYDNIKYRRVGDSMEVSMSFRRSGGTQGDGYYLFEVPAGLQIDLTKIQAGPISNNVINNGTRLGTGEMRHDSSFGAHTSVYAFDATRVYMVQGAGVDAAGGGSHPYTGDVYGLPTGMYNGGFTANYTVPIVGWESSTKYATTSCEGMSCFNGFSARVQNNGTATVLSEDLDFIDTVSRTLQGKVTVTFTSGLFTQTPSCTATTHQASDVNGSTVHLVGASASSVQVWMKYEGVTFSDKDFTINCQRQGDDFLADDSRFIEVNDVDNVSVYYIPRYSAVNTFVHYSGPEVIDTVSGVTINLKTDAYTVAPSVQLTTAGLALTTADTIAVNTRSGSVTDDTIVVQQTFATNSGATRDFWVTITSSGVDYHDPKAFVGNINPAGFVKTVGVANPKMYSARLSATGVVSRETGDWLNGNCAVGNCSINVGVFTQTPTCIVSSVTVQNMCNGNATSTTNINVPCYLYTGGGNSGVIKDIICHGE